MTDVTNSTEGYDWAAGLVKQLLDGTGVRRVLVLMVEYYANKIHLHQTMIIDTLSEGVSHPSRRYVRQVKQLQALLLLTIKQTNAIFGPNDEPS